MEVNMTVVNAASRSALSNIVSGMDKHHGYPQTVSTGVDTRLGHYAVLVNTMIPIELDAEGDDTALQMILDHYIDRDDVDALVAHDGTMITLV
jgi:hypothetical protein